MVNKVKPQHKLFARVFFIVCVLMAILGLVRGNWLQAAFSLCLYLGQALDPEQTRTRRLAFIVNLVLSVILGVALMAVELRGM